MGGCASPIALAPATARQSTKGHRSSADAGGRMIRAGRRKGAVQSPHGRRGVRQSMTHPASRVGARGVEGRRRGPQRRCETLRPRATSSSGVWPGVKRGRIQCFVPGSARAQRRSADHSAAAAGGVSVLGSAGEELPRHRGHPRHLAPRRGTTRLSGLPKARRTHAAAGRDPRAEPRPDRGSRAAEPVGLTHSPESRGGNAAGCPAFGDPNTRRYVSPPRSPSSIHCSSSASTSCAFTLI